MDVLLCNTAGTYKVNISHSRRQESSLNCKYFVKEKNYSARYNFVSLIPVKVEARPLSSAGLFIQMGYRELKKRTFGCLMS